MHKIAYSLFSWAWLFQSIVARVSPVSCSRALTSHSRSPLAHNLAHTLWSCVNLAQLLHFLDICCVFKKSVVRQRSLKLCVYAMQNLYSIPKYIPFVIVCFCTVVLFVQCKCQTVLLELFAYSVILIWLW